MDGTAWAAVITVAGTLIGLVVTMIKFGATRRDDSGRHTYDQLQEDLANARADIISLRADFTREKDERRLQWESDQRQIRYQGGIIRHLDDEVVAIREGIQTGRIPPLPPRNPWPAFPGEWTEVHP